MTAALADEPVLRFFRELEDPSLYRRVDNVPIFTSHERRKRASDGSWQTVRVDDNDLAEIVRVASRLEREEGVLPRLIPGHTRSGRDVPESEQPEPWGWVRHLRIGYYRMPDGRQRRGLLATFYIRADRADAARTYPFRSVEYYPDTHEITAVSLLRRDPELNLGVIAFGRRGRLYQYAMENVMPDTTEMDPTLPPDADGDSGAGGPPDGHDEWRKHLDYACGNHPVLKYASEQAAKATAPPPADPAAGAAPPPPAPLPPAGNRPPPDMMRRDRVPTQYEREALERAEAAERRAADAERLARLVQYRSELERLRDVEGYELDVDEEMTDCADMARERFSRHVGKIRANYQRAPIGGPRAPVAGSGHEGGTRGDRFGDDLLEKATRYMREHPGCDWKDAEDYARGHRTLAGTPLMTQSTAR